MTRGLWQELREASLDAWTITALLLVGGVVVAIVVMFLAGEL